MSELIIAFGLFLVIEGLIYASAPSFLKKMAKILPQIPDHQLRISGVISIAIGVGLVWIIRG